MTTFTRTQLRMEISPLMPPVPYHTRLISYGMHVSPQKQQDGSIRGAHQTSTARPANASDGLPSVASGCATRRRAAPRMTCVDSKDSLLDEGRGRALTTAHTHPLLYLNSLGARRLVT